MVAVIQSYLRSISKRRLGLQPFGEMSQETMWEVENVLRLLMEL